MAILLKSRLFVLLLFIALTASLTWCALDNVAASVQAVQTENNLPASTVNVLSGFLWLLGYGIHSAAAVAVPLLLWPRGKPAHDAALTGTKGIP